MASAAADVAHALSLTTTRILQYCRENPKGVTGDMIQTGLGVSLREISVPLNSLLTESKLEIVTRGNVPHFLVASESTAKLAGMDVDERLIYQIIEAAGNKGIWLRDIRAKSNLEQKRVNSIIKKLRNTKLIKSVTSVVALKKKLYMLFDLEPDESLTGGAWYADEEFDGLFVDTLRKLVMKYLGDRCPQHLTYDTPMQRNNAALARLAEVHEYIVQSKISNQVLRERDIGKVLNTLVHDGSVEKRERDGEEVFKIAKHMSPTAGLYSAPCGSCPVQHKCVEGGVVSPEGCVYLKAWAEF